VKSGLEENIKVMGHLADEEKLGVLKSSRVLLFPSYYESFGIVILESMACGVPVVCYDLPPLRSLFSKGLVRVPVGDMDRFAEETMKILGDDSLREKLSHEGSEFAEACDWGLIAEKEEEIIGRPLP
ncbi:MAG: glycosyltransferase family 4 protein, partial [Methanomassiliicoccales archaeon]|nr:glycosyltransferase family 4 protein [Methanomassiliicoccales archaeon]